MLKKLFTLFSAVTTFLLPFAVYAKNAQQLLLDAGKSAGFDTDQQEMGIYNIISAVINVSLSLVGVIFLVLIIYGGYTYMTAGGDESKVEKARDTITRAVIGLFIVLLSYAIANFVIPSLVCAINPGSKGCTVVSIPK